MYLIDCHSPRGATFKDVGNVTKWHHFLGHHVWKWWW